MAMHRVAIVVTLFGVVFAVPAWCQIQSEDMSREACLSSGESRDLFVADKLVPPIRVMRETARNQQAEAIDIQLCRTQGMLVYDVTLLDAQGRVLHRLVNAVTGVLLPGNPARPAIPPRPAQAPRPQVKVYPDFDEDVPVGRRFRPDFFQGPRSGPYMLQGPRPGNRFFPGPRPGERGPGEME